MFKSTTRTTQEKLQQYFTNDKLAEELINKSNIIKSKTTVEILEPSAGDGQLVKPLCKLLKIDYNVDLVEIDKNNRIKLEELVKAAPNIIKLEAHKNFLTFIPSKRYDFVFMNPPFHLRKDSNGLLKHDVFDFHFIKRAYAMLKLGGCLMAITGKHWMNVDEMEKWYKSVKFEYEEKKNQMFSGVKVDVHIIKIIKKSEAEDNEILDTEFYNTYDTELGIEVMNAELSFKQLKESQTEKVKINDEPLMMKKKNDQLIQPPEVPTKEYKPSDFKSKDFLKDAIELYYRDKGQALTNLAKMNYAKLLEIVNKRNIPLDKLVEFYNKAIDRQFYFYGNSTSDKITKLKKKWKELYITKNVEPLMMKKKSGLIV